MREEGRVRAGEGRDKERERERERERAGGIYVQPVCIVAKLLKMVYMH